MNWLERYKDTLNIRYETFKTLFEISHDRKLTNIVETGTARGKIKYYYFKPKINWKDGMSTLLFAEYANLVGGLFWSCDIISGCFPSLIPSIKYNPDVVSLSTLLK